MPGSEWYKDWFNSPYYHKLYFNRDEQEAEKFISQLLNFLKPPAGSKMVDVACGKGRHSKFLAEQGFNVTGLDVIDLGLSTTPTVEIATKKEGAAGGIIITASHNPKEWNALKLLNSEGEFISGELGARVLKMADKENFSFSPVDKIGMVTKMDG